MSSAWLWLIVAVLLFVSELLTGAFILLFFALSALLVVLLTWLGFLVEPQWQVIVFSLGGIMGLWLLRKPLTVRLNERSEKLKVGDVDQLVVLGEELKPGESTHVEYQGSTFTAVNESEETLKAGHQARIVRTEGVRLFLGPKKRS